MKVLLDTAAFLWFVMGDAKLISVARSAIEEPSNDKILSIASAWEIAIKASIGKLSLAEPFEILIPREIRQNGFQCFRLSCLTLRRCSSSPSTTVTHSTGF